MSYCIICKEYTANIKISINPSPVCVKCKVQRPGVFELLMLIKNLQQEYNFSLIPRSTKYAHDNLSFEIVRHDG